MLLNQIRVPYGAGIMESYTLSPWLSLAEDEFYEIPVHYIILAANIKDTLKDNYIKYVQDRKESELEQIESEKDDLEVEESETTIENETNYENSQITRRRRGRLVH